MKNKKILITGGAGFIGSNLALALQEKYPENEYFVLDNFSSGDWRNLSGFEGEVITGNISEIDLEKYFPEGLDVIFHQAAITDTIIKDQNRMMSVNVGGFRNVFGFCLKNNTRLIYASSAAVYGKSKPPMRVGEKEKPSNVYGFSKLAADNIARKYFDKIPIIGLRYFNVYGPRERYKGKMASMVWQLYKQMKKGERPKLFKFGDQKRDQVYVKDVIKANLLALKAEKSGIYNIGTGKATTFNRIVEELNKILDTDLEPKYIENPYQHYQDFTEADLSRTEKVLQYEPEFDIKKGVGDYFA